MNIPTQIHKQRAEQIGTNFQICRARSNLQSHICWSTNTFDTYPQHTFIHYIYIFWFKHEQKRCSGWLRFSCFWFVLYRCICFEFCIVLLQCFFICVVLHQKHTSKQWLSSSLEGVSIISTLKHHKFLHFQPTVKQNLLIHFNFRWGKGRQATMKRGTTTHQYRNLVRSLHGYFYWSHF